MMLFLVGVGVGGWGCIGVEFGSQQDQIGLKQLRVETAAAKQQKWPCMGAPCDDNTNATTSNHCIPQVTFIGSPKHIKSPYLRSKLSEVLHAWLPQGDANGGFRRGCVGLGVLGVGVSRGARRGGRTGAKHSPSSQQQLLLKPVCVCNLEEHGFPFHSHTSPQPQPLTPPPQPSAPAAGRRPVVPL